jgi:hypothetical protein
MKRWGLRHDFDSMRQQLPHFADLANEGAPAWAANGKE